MHQGIKVNVTRATPAGPSSSRASSAPCPPVSAPTVVVPPPCVCMCEYVCMRVSPPLSGTGKGGGAFKCSCLSQCSSLSWPSSPSLVCSMSSMQFVPGRKLDVAGPSTSVPSHCMPDRERKRGWAREYAWLLTQSNQACLFTESNTKQHAMPPGLSNTCLLT